MSVDFSVISACMGAAANLLAIVLAIATIIPFLQSVIEEKFSDGISQLGGQAILRRVISLIVLCILAFTLALIAGTVAGLTQGQGVYGWIGWSSLGLFLVGTIGIGYASISVALVYWKSLSLK